MIARPTKEAMKRMMSILRSGPNPNNAFFVSEESGELIGHAYCGKDSYFPSIPKGSYELRLGKSASRSYSVLEERIAPQYISADEQARMVA